ncbi:hypothetical protein Rhal01_03741 [Rubritalea halochordaticola]|uniref:GYF domain-containing protein n=1 Tax=Rubritalea halochordaticola TaxID=714537 RepID=A0ABP9V665_9BACT
MEEARYYIKGREEIGLVDSFTLRQHILNHSLKAESLVRMEDTTQWIKLGSLQLWENVKQPPIEEPEDLAPQNESAEDEDRLEISITIFGFLAFLAAFFILMLGFNSADLLPALLLSACAVLIGLLLLAVARILRYLRTLVEQGKERTQED